MAKSPPMNIARSGPVARAVKGVPVAPVGKAVPAVKAVRPVPLLSSKRLVQGRRPVTPLFLPSRLRPSDLTSVP